MSCNARGDNIKLHLGLDTLSTILVCFALAPVGALLEAHRPHRLRELQQCTLSARRRGVKLSNVRRVNAALRCISLRIE